MTLIHALKEARQLATDNPGSKALVCSYEQGWSVRLLLARVNDDYHLPKYIVTTDGDVYRYGGLRLVAKMFLS